MNSDFANTTFFGGLFYSCMDLLQNEKAYENRS